MLYILEGCDGSGKSTIARNLKTILDAQVIHCSTKTPNDFLYFRAIIEASARHNIIADRFIYGQFVYQKPEERKISEQDLYRLEAGALNSGVKAIYVCAHEVTIGTRLMERNEELINGLCVREILERYQKVIDNSMLYWETWLTD